MSNNLITEEKNERVYFSMIPNMICELGLSVYAMALYVRLKRRAGETGECWESTRNLAAGCRMSTKKVGEAKRELEAAGLIKIKTAEGIHGGRPYHVITIVDVWQRNLELFSQGSTGTLQVVKIPLARFRGATKEEPYKNKGEEGGAASSAALCSASSEAETSLLPPTSRGHPAIQAIKEVTGYYPPKNLYRRIVEKLGEEPDIERLQLTYDTWTANGYNPMDYKGWLFDWYKEEMYYVPAGKKFADETSEL